MNPRHVLVVDDEPDIALIAEACLIEFGGMAVQIARSGPEALARVARSRPDVVLLDVMLPGMDGLAVLRALQRDPATANLPVILMTARTHSSALAELHELCPLGVIVKPFDPLALAQEVLDLCAAL